MLLLRLGSMQNRWPGSNFTCRYVEKEYSKYLLTQSTCLANALHMATRHQ